MNARLVTIAAAFMMITASCGQEETLSALPTLTDTPQWVVSSCEGTVATYTLHPVDGSPATLLHSYNSPREDRPGECDRLGASGEVSPNGTQLLLPVEPHDWDQQQRSWAFYSTTGSTSNVELGGYHNGAIWSPDETQVLALTHWPPQNWPDGDDSGGQADDNPGADFVMVDIASGKTSTAIPSSSDLNVLLSWEPDGRIVGRQSGPEAARPLTITLEDPNQQPMTPQDHYRLNQVGADDWRSIANGWDEIAFDGATPVCRLQAEIAPPWAELSTVDLPDACVIKVAGVVAGQFLASMDQLVDDSQTELNALVDPTNGTWTNFLSSSENELIRIEHVAADQVVVFRRDRATGEQRLVVLDETQTEILTLDSSQDPRSSVIGLLRP